VQSVSPPTRGLGPGLRPGPGPGTGPEARFDAVAGTVGGAAKAAARKADVHGVVARMTRCVEAGRDMMKERRNLVW
jgi:hypothetical protein